MSNKGTANRPKTQKYSIPLVLVSCKYKINCTFVSYMTLVIESINQLLDNTYGRKSNRQIRINNKHTQETYITPEVYKAESRSKIIKLFSHSIAEY